MSNKVDTFDAKLLTCINNGKKVALAKSLIQNMKNAHIMKNQWGSTLLHYSAKYGNNAIAEYLIKLGSDINARDLQGRTPLVLALENDRDSTVRFLLEKNANINIKNKKGQSALQIVVHKSLISHKLIEDFLNKLKNENSCNDSRSIAKKLREVDCPLKTAVLLNDPEVTKLILLASAHDIDDSDIETGETALHIAVRKLSLANVNLLIRHGAHVNAVNFLGFTPLENLDVKKDGSLEILKILLDEGAKMFTDSNVCQIISILEHSRKETIHFLMQYHIDLNVVDEHGNTVLHYLASNKNANVFDELPGKKFDVNTRNNNLYTPLLLVISNYSSLKFLLSNGADVNASRNSMTALTKIFHTKANYGKKLEGSLSRVNLLLQYNADPQSVFIDNDVFDTFRALRENSYSLFKPVVAHLALLHETGTSICKTVIRKIDEHDFLKKYYNLCRSQLNDMKSTKKEATVWETINKYKLLTASEKQLAIYMRQPKLRDIVSSNSFNFGSCYENFGSERVRRAMSKVELWENSIDIFCNMLKLPYEKYYDVMEKIIVSYLSEQDMHNLCFITEK